jgi:hypothetical protein
LGTVDGVVAVGVGVAASDDGGVRACVTQELAHVVGTHVGVCALRGQGAAAGYGRVLAPVAGQVARRGVACGSGALKRRRAAARYYPGHAAVGGQVTADRVARAWGTAVRHGVAASGDGGVVTEISRASVARARVPCSVVKTMGERQTHRRCIARRRCS